MFVYDHFENRTSAAVPRNWWFDSLDGVKDFSFLQSIQISSYQWLQGLFARVESGTEHTDNSTVQNSGLRLSKQAGRTSFTISLYFPSFCSRRAELRTRTLCTIQ